MSAPQLLRVSAMAQRLAISRSQAYRLIASGEIAVVHVGETAIRVTEEDLRTFVARKRETSQ